MSAKGLKLDSLLGNNKNKGIETMAALAKEKEENKDNKKEEVVQSQSTPVNKVQSKKVERVSDSKREDDHKPSILPSELESIVEHKKEEHEEPALGRPIIFDDVRYKAMEPARISANVKIKLQSLIGQKFDDYSQNKMIDFLIDYYMEKELPKEERMFLNQLIDQSMEEIKQSKKYKKYF